MLNTLSQFSDRQFFLGGFSGYLKLKEKKSFYSHIFTNASMQELMNIFPTLQIGLGQRFDALLQDSRHSYFFYFIDEINSFTDLREIAKKYFSFNLESFFYDLKKDCYYDIFNQYRKTEIQPLFNEVPIDSFLEAVSLSNISNIPFKNFSFTLTGQTSSYFFRIIAEEFILKGTSHEGFSLLNRYDLLKHYLPEISVLENIHHDKDYHPEGDGLAHTLECLKYLKSKNLILGWSVILHDIGKAVSESSQKRKFDNHAQLGGFIAQKVLQRMGYDEDFIEKVVYLVKNHMLPMFIPHMNYKEKDRLLSQPLLKELFQLFKIDILGSHRDMNYYQKIKSSFLREESHV